MFVPPVRIRYTVRYGVHGSGSMRIRMRTAARTHRAAAIPPRVGATASPAATAAATDDDGGRLAAAAGALRAWWPVHAPAARLRAREGGPPRPLEIYTLAALRALMPAGSHLATLDTGTGIMLRRYEYPADWAWHTALENRNENIGLIFQQTEAEHRINHRCGTARACAVITLEPQPPG